MGETSFGFDSCSAHSLVYHMEVLHPLSPLLKRRLRIHFFSINLLHMGSNALGVLPLPNHLYTGTPYFLYCKQHKSLLNTYCFFDFHILPIPMLTHGGEYSLSVYLFSTAIFLSCLIYS